MPNDARYRRHPDVLLQPDGGGAIALHPGTKQYYDMNASALFLWQKLASPCTVSELAALVAAEYDADTNQVTLWIADTLEIFEAEGLVRREGAAGKRARLKRWLTRA
jgi:hypothetical protein